MEDKQDEKISKAAIKSRKYREKHPTNDSEWRERNRDKIRQQARNFYQLHKEEEKARSIEKRKHEKPEKRKARMARADKKRLSTPQGRLHLSIGNVMRYSLRGGSKTGRKWECLVGYTIEKLKQHLEKQFKDGMTWENYGKWHVDHRIPITAFNFTCPEDIDFKKCWALKNLQPLWARENITKNNKLEKPFQPSLALNSAEGFAESYGRG